MSQEWSSELLSPTLLLHRAFPDPSAGLREGHRAHSEPLKANGNLGNTMGIRISALPLGPETRNAGAAAVTACERLKPVQQRHIPEMKTGPSRKDTLAISSESGSNRR